MTHKRIVAIRSEIGDALSAHRSVASFDVQGDVFPAVWFQIDAAFVSVTHPVDSLSDRDGQERRLPVERSLELWMMTSRLIRNRLERGPLSGVEMAFAAFSGLLVVEDDVRAPSIEF